MSRCICFVLVILAVGCSTPQVKEASFAPAPRTDSDSTNPCLPTETAFNCVKVVEVYDGDSIFVDLPNQHPLFGKRMGVRVFGIDTPELRTKNSCEKKKAEEAKAVLTALLGKAERVDIVNVQKDKYFRILGTIVADGRSIADELIKRGLAYPYHGEKKLKRNWCK